MGATSNNADSKTATSKTATSKTDDAIERRIDAVVAALDLDEKVAMLSGHGFTEQITEDGGRYCARLYHIGAGNERLDVAPLLFNDGPRGVAMGASTCFPVPMARGASFDTDLERRVGEAIGRELRAHGGNLFGGVCINLLRHPAWGRAQETYGEDPVLLGRMGAALVDGVQRHGVAATIKHFAANSMENARFTVDVAMDERALREVYLRHFEHCVRAGALAVMSAYNKVRGAYCGHNRELLTDILKDQWGFDGFVYSDFVMGCYGADAAAAGLDVEAPDTIHFGDGLTAAVRDGRVSEERIDDAVARVLRTLFRTQAVAGDGDYPAALVACPDHVDLAREAAAKSVVLLKNSGALPWNAATVGRILVVGALADQANLGDHGSSRVYPPWAVTALEGLRRHAPEHCEIVHDAGKDLELVRTLAAGADVVLVVAGYTHRDEGEFIPGQMVDLSGDTSTSIGGDRVDLRLGPRDEALIAAVAEVNAATAVAVMSGSAVTMDAWEDSAGAILLWWYPGMEGGTALAEILFGEVNPSGRLPFTIPRSADDLPYFDRDATEITYDLWHGYTKLERDGTEAAYPFGFGLSYSTFAFSDVDVSVAAAAGTMTVSVRVTNEGERDGDCVVQVYAGWETPDDAHPRKRLCGFTRIAVAAAATERATVDVNLADLKFYDPDTRTWRLGAERWTVSVGASSAPADLLTTPVTL